MNEIKAKYIFMRKVEPFEIKIENCRVLIEGCNNEFFINILARKSVNKLYDLLTDLESLIFFYSGYFPLMVCLEINGEIQDISDRIGKYYTSTIFVKQNLTICEISSLTITEQILYGIRNMNQMALLSFQNLVSKSYDHVIVDHKITLLLHVIEGLYDDKNLDSDCDAIKKKYQETPSRVGKYMAGVYRLCNEYFFKYHRKYNCQILPLLKVTQFQFLRKLTDTRHWYSHFLRESQKSSRIKQGEDFVIYFQILCYTIRLSVIDRLGITPNEEYIKEFYYCVHNWIQKIVYKKDYPLKSKTYKVVRNRKIPIEKYLD